MKDQILKLRSEGKSYRKIEEMLGCSRSTISYHCGEGQREKFRARARKSKNRNRLVNRVYNYKGKVSGKNKRRKLNVSARDFQRKSGWKLTNRAKGNLDFNSEDVIKKYGVETQCYLSGEKINLLEDNHYCLDHIVPPKSGGDNSLENAGILHKIVNRMKTDLSVDEFLAWCKKILEHNGYEVKKGGIA